MVQILTMVLWWMLLLIGVLISGIPCKLLWRPFTLPYTTGCPQKKKTNGRPWKKPRSHCLLIMAIIGCSLEYFVKVWRYFVADTLFYFFSRTPCIPWRRILFTAKKGISMVKNRRIVYPYIALLWWEGREGRRYVVCLKTYLIRRWWRGCLIHLKTSGFYFPFLPFFPSPLPPLDTSKRVVLMGL